MSIRSSIFLMALLLATFHTSAARYVETPKDLATGKMRLEPEPATTTEIAPTPRLTATAHNTPFIKIKFSSKNVGMVESPSIPYILSMVSEAQMVANTDDGTFVPVEAFKDGLPAGNIILAITRNGQMDFIGCSIEGKIEEGKVPEFTISEGAQYLHPCFNNLGVTLHCGEYDQKMMSKC